MANGVVREHGFDAAGRLGQLAYFRANGNSLLNLRY
jgi:hypothetical protein